VGGLAFAATVMMIIGFFQIWVIWSLTRPGVVRT
jgi:hypothetical protein